MRKVLLEIDNYSQFAGVVTISIYSQFEHGIGLAHTRFFHHIYSWSCYQWSALDFRMMSAGNNMRLLVHFDLVKPRNFHKTSQAGINYDTRLFMHFCNEKPRGLHKTSQTSINSDMRLFIHFNSVKPRGFHETSQTRLTSINFDTRLFIYILVV